MGTRPVPACTRTIAATKEAAGKVSQKGPGSGKSPAGRSMAAVDGAGKWTVFRTTAAAAFGQPNADPWSGARPPQQLSARRTKESAWAPKITQLCNAGAGRHAECRKGRQRRGKCPSDPPASCGFLRLPALDCAISWTRCHRLTVRSQRSGVLTAPSVLRQRLFAGLFVRRHNLTRTLASASSTKRWTGRVRERHPPRESLLGLFQKVSESTFRMRGRVWPDGTGPPRLKI